MTRTKKSTVILLLAAVILGAGAVPAQAAPPSNDDFNSAKPIANLPFSEEIDTTEATRQGTDPTNCVGDHTVWYSFTAPRDMRIEVDPSGSDYFAIVSVWTGQPGSLQQVACSGNRPVRFFAGAGTTYHVVVSGDGGILSFAAHLPPPAPRNDSVGRARAIQALPFEHVVDTSEASFAPSDPRCGGRRDSVWYSLRRKKEKRLQIDTLRSNYDTSLSVWTRKNGEFRQVACNDNAGSSRSRVRLKTEARKTYFILVTARSDGGRLSLRVKEAPPRFKMSLHVASSGTVSGVTGGASVKGTITCNRASRVLLTVEIRQRVDKRVISDDFHLRRKCKGVDRWRANFKADRAFFPGPAGVKASAFATKFETRKSRSKTIVLSG